MKTKTARLGLRWAIPLCFALPLSVGGCNGPTSTSSSVPSIETRIERINNNPKMPEAAKKAALRSLEQERARTTSH